MKASFLLLLSSLVVFGAIGVCRGGGLKKDFYRDSCPNAEKIERNITWTLTAADPGLAADLLRLHYHDCFVRGCDASLLLDSTPTNQAEKDAGPNLSIEGFDVIDNIKAEIEKVCKGVVSCADIAALAARDAVSFQFNRAIWDVLTGRKDGRVSLASEVIGNLPSPFANFTVLQQSFANKGLDVKDLVNYQNRGLFESDTALLTNKGSSKIVNQLLKLKSKDFLSEFAESVQKMGAIGVLTGNAGEIRNQCRVVNS
ncbi:hypothetical protein AAC387_Pa03g2207 [Persea americana]